MWNSHIMKYMNYLHMTKLQNPGPVCDTDWKYLQSRYILHAKYLLITTSCYPDNTPIHETSGI